MRTNSILTTTHLEDNLTFTVEKNFKKVTNTHQKLVRNLEISKNKNEISLKLKITLKIINYN